MRKHRRPAIENGVLIEKIYKADRLTPIREKILFLSALGWGIRLIAKNIGWLHWTVGKEQKLICRIFKHKGTIEDLGWQLIESGYLPWRRWDVE